MLVLDEQIVTTRIYLVKMEFWVSFTSVTLPDITVNDREEKPVLSNPAVCKGHPHMLISSIADL